jgi:hypothetical protein
MLHAPHIFRILGTCSVFLLLKVHINIFLYLCFGLRSSLLRSRLQRKCCTHLTFFFILAACSVPVFIVEGAYIIFVHVPFGLRSSLLRKRLQRKSCTHLTFYVYLLHAPSLFLLLKVHSNIFVPSVGYFQHKCCLHLHAYHFPPPPNRCWIPSPPHCYKVAL